MSQCSSKSQHRSASTRPFHSDSAGSQAMNDQKSAELGHTGTYKVKTRSGKDKSFKAKTIGRLKPVNADEDDEDEKPKAGLPTLA